MLDEKNDISENDERMAEVMLAASNIIVFSDNTEKKLREKLFHKGFDEELIDYAVNRLKVAGVVNDERLIRSYCTYLAEKKLYGKIRIKFELQKKGFERELINECFEECVEGIDFKKNCVKLIYKKKFVNKITDEKSAKNVTATLARYGYSYAEIKYAYTRLLEEYEED